MLLIHAEPTSRLSYVLDVFFGERGLIPIGYRITQHFNEFRSYSGPRIAYGEQPFTKPELFIRSHGLLAEEGITPQDPESFTWEDTLALFPVKDGDLPFDVFAAAFYLISRYEEYGSTARDDHGRYLPSASILHQHGFLRKPVVNQYAVHLRQMLEQLFRRVVLPPLPFTPISTIDVDVAYAYRGRSLLEALGGLVKSIFMPSKGGFFERIAVLSGRKGDPYDTYDWISEAHEAVGLSPIYFFLMRRSTGLDRAIDPRSEIMQALIRRIAGQYEIGLHPSYGSFQEPQRIRKEKELLEEIAQSSITRNRQHFLRFELPVTFRTLIELGIQEEYSMGYAGEAGFRAGIAHPYPFYDLPREEQTSLILYPAVCMDGTLRDYQKLSVSEAEALVRELVEAVRSTGGTFVSIWHNSTVTERDDRKGWRNLYTFLLGMITAQKHSAT